MVDAELQQLGERRHMRGECRGVGVELGMAMVRPSPAEAPVTIADLPRGCSFEAAKSTVPAYGAY
jgi:hypothetical protein